MFNTTRKYSSYVLAAANLLVIGGMLLTGYSGCFNPQEHPRLAVIGLAFPVFLILNLLFIFVWPFFKKRFLLLPILGLLMSYDLLADYCPLNIQTEHPDGSIKVLTYNVLGFNYSAAPKEQLNEILQYLIDSKADIICVQEWSDSKSQQPEQWKDLDRLYPYVMSLTALGPDGKGLTGGDRIAVMSKYPILRAENLPIESKGNVAGVFTLNIRGEIVKVLNLHLETVGFSQEEKETFKQMVKGSKDKEEIKDESKTLFSKLSSSAVIRAKQADVVADYLEKYSGEKIILCGDFNDHPLSYTHRTIAGLLTDCYRESGSMPGVSHNQKLMYVRIDNIMCSKHWQSYECQTDKSVKLSDHYPVFCYFKQK